MQLHLAWSNVTASRLWQSLEKNSVVKNKLKKVSHSCLNVTCCIFMCNVGASVEVAPCRSPQLAVLFGGDGQDDACLGGRPCLGFLWPIET